MPVQPKAELGAIDDPLEAEADRVADQVTGDGEAPGQVTPISQAGVQTSRTAGAAAASGGGAEMAAQAVQSGGRPMSATERGYFEPRFGQDFSDVRIHEGSNAAYAAASIDARAYTVGKDIAFNSGAYRPESAEGRWLMAHELTHTLQQDGGVRAKRVQRYDLPDPRKLWDRAERFGKRKLKQGADLADKAIDKAGKAADAAGKAAEGWWDRGSGDITRIDFDGAEAKVSGAVSASYKAISGLMPSKKTGGVDYTDPKYQDVPDKGPIPEGEYYLNPAEVESNPPGKFNTTAWGKYRTRLHETLGTSISRKWSTKRTGGFYLHQDANHNGTAGCIGIWNTSDNKKIHDLIVKNTAQIPVHVKYKARPKKKTTPPKKKTVRRVPLHMRMNAISASEALIQRQPLGPVVRRDPKKKKKKKKLPYLIRKGIAKINSDKKLYGTGKFPSNYYEILARYLFNKELRRNGRDYGDAFSELDDVQWGNKGSALRKHYEKVVGTDSTNGWDKFRHFVFTAYLQYKSYGILAPEAFTYGKELFDEAEQWLGMDPEGYSIPDIVADNRGEKFGEEMAEQENQEMIDRAKRAVSRGITEFMDPRSWGL